VSPIKQVYIYAAVNLHQFNLNCVAVPPPVSPARFSPHCCLNMKRQTTTAAAFHHPIECPTSWPDRAPTTTREVSSPKPGERRINRTTPSCHGSAVIPHPGHFGAPDDIPDSLASSHHATTPFPQLLRIVFIVVAIVEKTPCGTSHPPPPGTDPSLAARRPEATP
jgi:hypothetical protein